MEWFSSPITIHNIYIHTLFACSIWMRTDVHYSRDRVVIQSDANYRLQPFGCIIGRQKTKKCNHFSPPSQWLPTCSTSRHQTYPQWRHSRFHSQSRSLLRSLSDHIDSAMILHGHHTIKRNRLLFSTKTIYIKRSSMRENVPKYPLDHPHSPIGSDIVSDRR